MTPLVFVWQPDPGVAFNAVVKFALSFTITTLRNNSRARSTNCRG
jgi:multisubunit Na+/H+ antiporter MnhB subunit